MKISIVAAFVLSAACVANADEKTKAVSPMPIQRTMNALEKSTASHPSRVRMLFYGQSIVEQGWHTNIVRQLKERYPTAVLEVENRAIGGFTSPDLIRTAESDLYSFYPDILFFHVYGPTDKYEEIIRKVRATTTAEIVLWTSHLEKKECETRESIEAILANPDERSKAIEDIAARHGCLFIDLRKKWCRMMLDTGVGYDKLLKDGIHLNAEGPAFCYYSNFIAEELVRVPAANGLAEFSGTITEIPVTDGRVRSGPGGSLVLEFDGNRVVAVSDGTGCGVSDVLLDSKPPQEYPEMYFTTRPSKIVSWMPMIKHVETVPGVCPVAEDWTLTYIEGTKPLGDPVRYKVEGSVTGFDGEGWNTNDFKSVSGRVVINKSDFHTWQYRYFIKECNGDKSLDSAPGQTITWSTRPLFANPFSGGKMDERTTIVQNCSNGRHILSITPADGGRIGIKSFIVYTPARRQ